MKAWMWCVFEVCVSGYLLFVHAHVYCTCVYVILTCLCLRCPLIVVFNLTNQYCFYKVMSMCICMWLGASTYKLHLIVVKLDCCDNSRTASNKIICTFCPVAECFDCDFGRYCMTPGLNQSEGPCSAGHYCLSGASTPTPTDGTTGNVCPQGRYCVEGIGYNGMYCL